ncbi:MAG: glycerol acyltransferase [Bacteroidetes bacterium]|nr:MAG: glycerol acyltransferase [Bacteroidota bacterium]
MTGSNEIYPQLYPDITDWPIYKLYKERSDFVRAIDDQTIDNLLERYGDDVSKVIARTTYLELIRLKQNPWKSDPPNEKQFWQRVRKEVIQNSKHKPKIKQARNEELLRRVIHRYSEEIAGNFSKKTFLFARKFLTAFFKRLLNTAAGRNHQRIWGSKHNLYERFRVFGDVDKVRNSYAHGTVVIVPTHFSNLDSILIGYALDTIIGLPSASYGAGLNLYESEIVAYYMSRLGAYRVDRRKKNHIYLETLKTMSNLSLQRGVNSLFFPGGTRSRSGALDKDLKMGLLGSIVEAQRSIYQNDEDRKIIIVPLVISYHFVLEARQLIDQFLERSGEEKYLLAKDEFQSTGKILKFAWQVFSKSSNITLSFGAPMDVMGNLLDENGKSFDERGNVTSIRDYFISEGKIEKNKQRESVYTRHLGKSLVESFKIYNVVLSSHLVAFAAFEMLKRLNSDLDVFGLISMPTDEYTFDKGLLLDVIGQLQNALRGMQNTGEIRLSGDVENMSQEALFEEGIKNLGAYHVQQPLHIDKRGLIKSQNFELLLFYHNRLENYELNKTIVWDEELVQRAIEVSNI